MFRHVCFGIGVIVALAGVSCDKAQLLAPTNSTVTLSAQSRVLPTGGSTEVSAAVIESGGTPVQNGTTVRFTTTLGRVDPIEAQTRNGIAVTTFFAGNDSGIAEVRGTSGGAGGTAPPATTPPTTTTTTTNIVQISVGSGAVDTVTVRANPAVVSTNGGTVNVIATVVGVGGRLLASIPVSFSSSRGTLSSTSVLTDANGEARVTLTTNADTDISVAAGTKTATAKVTSQPGPAVTLTCAVGAVTNCATVTVGQAVLFTAQRVTGSGAVTSSTLDFGDGASISLGSLASPVNASHSYSQTGTFTARLTATDANGETTTAVQPVQVSDVANISVTTTKAGMTVTATATVTGANVSQYAWTFQGTTPNATTSGNTATFTYAAAGTYTVSVTATLTDGRTVTASTPVVVP
ncbi:MAG TPA: PKD domain-containing protein [Vicinamibacterales bacterium]|nr:PKD domain-containing protein [Vicinamibacterales bacterium]